MFCSVCLQNTCFIVIPCRILANFTMGSVTYVQVCILFHRFCRIIFVDLVLEFQFWAVFSDMTNPSTIFTFVFGTSVNKIPFVESQQFHRWIGFFTDQEIKSRMKNTRKSWVWQHTKGEKKFWLIAPLEYKHFQNGYFSKSFFGAIVFD